MWCLGASRHEVGDNALERVTGIEPAPPAWKAGALAVELHPQVPNDGSRPGSPRSTDQAAGGALGSLLVGEGGFEPPTSCSQSRCATTALLPVTACRVRDRAETACQGVPTAPIHSPSA